MDETKAYRVYVLGFNIDMEMVQNLVIKKARNAGDFNIKFIHAALNKESYSAEIFIEFEESIRVSTLISQLESKGACQVNVITFKHNDANESASSALLRVWMAAEKTGYEHMKGEANKDLWDKTQHKYDAEMQKKEENEKNQAKLDEGIKQSLAEVGNKLGNIGSKVDNMDGRMNSVQQGVCVIIPDYQKMLKENMDKLVHKTKEVDRIENRMGRVTHENNKLVMENEELKQKLIQESRKHEREMAEMKEILNRKDEKIRDTEQIIEMYKVLENVKYIMDLDRATKRARGET